MAIRIDVFDGSQSYLENILELSYGMALQSLSQAGSKLQDASRKAMRGNTTRIFKDYSKGKAGTVFKYNKDSTQELGLRMALGSSVNGSASPSSMSRMITSYLMKKSLTVVVGGKHKSFLPTRYEGGKPVGSMNKVSAVSKATYSILHKMNTGKMNEKYLNHFDEFGGDMNFKAYHFMEDGYQQTRGQIADILTKNYQSLLSKAVDRANVKIVKRRVI